MKRFGFFVVLFSSLAVSALSQMTAKEENFQSRNKFPITFPAATFNHSFKKFTLNDRRLRSPQNLTRRRNRLQPEIPLKKFYAARFITFDEVFLRFELSASVA